MLIASWANVYELITAGTSATTIGATGTGGSISAPGHLTFAEIKEFASFTAGVQRYVRRSPDVAFDRKDAIALWSRDMVKARPLTSPNGWTRSMLKTGQATGVLTLGSYGRNPFTWREENARINASKR